jgi:hypothetical protein
VQTCMHIRHKEIWGSYQVSVQLWNFLHIFNRISIQMFFMCFITEVLVYFEIFISYATSDNVFCLQMWPVKQPKISQSKLTLAWKPHILQQSSWFSLQTGDFLNTVFHIICGKVHMPKAFPWIFETFLNSVYTGYGYFLYRRSGGDR